MGIDKTATTGIKLVEELENKTLMARELDSLQIETLLLLKGDGQQRLFKLARKTRAEHFGDKLKIRGVIEISNNCVKNCAYCAMRHANALIERYELDAEAILNTARQITETGIPTVFLQGAQDNRSDTVLFNVIPKIKERFGCEVLLCVGEKSENVYKRYCELGADSYILKFESSDKELYNGITGSNLDGRLKCFGLIRSAGMKTGTGNIIGLPRQTVAILANDIRLGILLKPDFISASPFIPNKGTPLEALGKGDADLTLNTMAIWRITLPNVLIPTVSALEYLHPGGQAAGLDAGANVITVNFTPKASRDKYAIYADDRFVVSLNHARETAAKVGLTLNLGGAV